MNFGSRPRPNVFDFGHPAPSVEPIPQASLPQASEDQKAAKKMRLAALPGNLVNKFRLPVDIQYNTTEP
jgi:hypothetical protein